MNDVIQEPLDILIADDHPLYSAGMRTLLDDLPKLHVVGEARTGAEALTMTAELQPRMVLMDVNLPRINGIEATKTIVSKFPQTSVIIITMHDDRDTFYSAMRAGARGYLLKETGAGEVQRVIETVRCGCLVFDPRVSNWLVEYLTKPAVQGRPFPELTDRERAVLELVANGRGNAAIARELGLSIKTVRNYLSRIFAKLQLVDRTEAAVRARRAGLGH